MPATELDPTCIDWSRWTTWLFNRSRCSCGYVHWAHWSNGQCAHCNCPQYDNAQPPMLKEVV